jgi:heme-degrading monooxygenase HmoA
LALGNNALGYSLVVEILEIFLSKSIVDENMFVVIAEIQLKKGTENEFKDWIKESNTELSKFDGFVRRRLLESLNGKHIILVEFETKEKFEAMHKTQEHFKIQSKGHSFMDTLPKPNFYIVSQ